MLNKLYVSEMMEKSSRIYHKGIKYGPEMLLRVADNFLRRIQTAAGLSAARERLHRFISGHHFDTYSGALDYPDDKIHRVRDCTRAFQFMLKERSEKLAGFSVAEALFDLAKGNSRPDLQDGFYAEMIHLFLGINGKGPELSYDRMPADDDISGRKAAILRSDILDRLWYDRVQKNISRYKHGLMENVQRKRKKNVDRILKVLGGTEADWRNWKWHFKHIIKDADRLSELIQLTKDQYRGIAAARETGTPFGITPYYVSLMDNKPGRDDAAVRAQVIPSVRYVDEISRGRKNNLHSFDFMLERDTSPVELITRRYPAIVILKPYNACPQICVYCQRNWEIDDVLAHGAMASGEEIDDAIEWIRRHPAIQDVLVTGGDPLALVDKKLLSILEKVASIPTIGRIRIGTRTPVTVPMRITPELARALGSLRIPMKREISVVTHVEHPYEITPEMHNAVELLRSEKINVYNQNVYTFYVSRRFEAVLLRMLLKRIGIEPYYTFNTKGKEETKDFRLPIARLLQEQKEEARLLPGLSRIDEAVYNVPGLGKNYLRAIQHRDVLSVLPNGARVYEFHPWEKNIRGQKTYVGTDVPILDYLRKLERFGEDISNYETIWYYY
jgi:lysine 2,3-aminomutase